MIYIYTILLQFNLFPLDRSIFDQIVENQPNIDRHYAVTLTKKIIKYSTKYKINPRIYSAILMQESAYRYNVRSGDDFGIAQINKHTAKAYGVDPENLLTDLELSVKLGAKILGDWKERRGHEKHYWCRYNVGRIWRDVDRENCAIYVERVKRWL